MIGKILDALGSFWLVCALLLNLALLTFFGTLYQVEGGLYEAQKLYFESWYVVQRSPVPLILPGGLFSMGLLAISLLVGGLWRIRKTWRTAGVIVIHVGMAMMLAAAFVKQYHSEDGYLALAEPVKDSRGNVIVPGEESDDFTSFHRLEVAIWDAAQKTEVQELLIPHEQIIDLTEGRARTFTHPSLPFELELSGFVENGRAMPKGPNWQAAGPTVEGYALLAMERDKDNERNIQGLTARFRDPAGKQTEALLSILERYPASFEAGGKTWAVSLRRQRFQMPFTIRLEDFRKEDHPGLTMARAFESDIIKVQDGREEKKLIQMNDPLRSGGLVLFQSSFGEDDTGRPFSQFSVVRNPSDHWPTISWYVIVLGMLIAFAPRLWRFAFPPRGRPEVPA
ncbi:MAG: cytochrome c biogenesis protein ResB [Planctomycetota bacterium]